MSEARRTGPRRGTTTALSGGGPQWAAEVSLRDAPAQPAKGSSEDGNPTRPGRRRSVKRPPAHPVKRVGRWPWWVRP
ncbi:hypothetical protein TNCT6_52510 [Streptomyces sp. 6-11-2]|nr:hypothetical protein TNCT6_52510 [Streptomyces sp. 6-11-2]